MCAGTQIYVIIIPIIIDEHRAHSEFIMSKIKIN